MLRGVGWLYQQIAEIRNSLYDRGVFRSHSLGARTISVGNLTLGGTGKTPLVAHVSEILAEAGEKVCVLTRGYGRENPNDRLLVSEGTKVLADAFAAGDEPIELAKQLIGKAIVVADRDRVSAARWAKEKFGITAFVLDDGFQHRRAERDLDIVCVEAIDPFGQNQNMLPGWVRERFRNISRADVIVITRSELVEDVDRIINEIAAYNRTAEKFLSKTELLPPKLLRHFLEDTESTDVETGLVFAFSGLGNPELFPLTLRRAGYELAGKLSFPDHIRYTQDDIDTLVSSARECEATSLVTTAKDGVKLGEFRFEIPCFVIEVRTTISDADRFRDLVISS